MDVWNIRFNWAVINKNVFQLKTESHHKNLLPQIYILDYSGKNYNWSLFIKHRVMMIIIMCLIGQLIFIFNDHMEYSDVEGKIIFGDFS